MERDAVNLGANLHFVGISRQPQRGGRWRRFRLAACGRVTEPREDYPKMETRCLQKVGELSPYRDGVTFHPTEPCTATQLRSLRCLHDMPTNVSFPSASCRRCCKTTSLSRQPSRTDLAQNLSASKCTLSAHTGCHTSQQLWLTLMTA